MKTTKVAKPSQVHFTVENIALHLERTFQYWTVKNPTTQIKLQRTATFMASLLITIFWPISSLPVNALLLALIWIMLSLTNKPVNRLFLLTNLMLNISLLFYLNQLWLTKTA